MNKKNFIPMLALAGLTTLAPLAAQEQQPGVSPEAEGQQEMSQPSSRSTSQNSGLTLTGEVIAMDQQALRVRTASGVENVILTNRTEKAAEVKTGDQVRVDFTRSSQGVIIATQVRKVAAAETGETGNASEPMSGSEVMGQAGQGTPATAPGSAAPGSTTVGTPDTRGTMGTTSGSIPGQQGLTEVSATGSQAEDTGDPVESTVDREDPRTNSASAPTQGQALDQTGQSGTTGSTYGSTTGSTTDTTGSSGTTGSTGSTTGSTGSTTDTMGSTGSTTGSTGSTGSTYDSNTGSTGSASSYDDQSASISPETTETGMESDTAATSDTLPDTGSSLPLAGLAGLLALSLAFVVRSLR